MKYNGFYFWMFKDSMKKVLAEKYDRAYAAQIMKKSKQVYRALVRQADDIGGDNPMAYMMTRTASGSMNGGITAATVPLWNRILRRGCRSTSAFTMSVSSRPRLPAFTSITLPSALWTLGHSPSRPVTPRMRSSTTISASRLKMDHFWRGGI